MRETIKMGVTKIVLTGGPCAGKSTGLAIIEERLKIAEEELKYKDMYDYVVINDDIEKATRMVKDIIEGNLCDGYSY